MNYNKMHRGLNRLLGVLALLYIPAVMATESGGEPAGPAAMSTKATIAVISHSDFVPDRTQAQGSSDQIGLPAPLAERIIEHLTNSKRFIPVEREALRRVVLEQRFGQDLQQSFLDKTLDRAIEVMGSPDDHSYVRVAPDAKSPAGRIPEGGGGVGTTGALADYNDILKDFQDLGTTLGADYVVVGNLARLDHTSSVQAVPYSKRTLREDVIDARLRLRVIDMRSGTVAGAASLQTQVSASVFNGMSYEIDLYDYFDDLGRDIAAKILDITFPARIVSLEPLVISRGSNDGAAAGDVYLVEREGKVIKDANGLEIARLKEKVGTVEVLEPQETVSIVKPLSGGEFAEHDLASLDLQASQARNKPAVARSGGALPGERAVQNDAAGKRATIAVGLVRVNPTARTNGLADGHVKRITDDLILKLGKTNRFVVLERQEVDQVFDEKTFDAMMQGEDIRSRLQELAGADYLIHGEITNFYTQRREEKIPYVSEVKLTVTGTGEGMLRIVDVHSGAIIAADKIRVTAALQNEADATLAMSNFIDRFTTDSVGLILERLYPVKVLAVTNDGSVYINRGSDAGLQAGMIFDVMRPGIELMDPDTGLSFGRAESKVATVEVTLVEQSRSTTSVVTGETPQSGDILHTTVVVKEKPKVKVNTPAW